MDCRHPPLHGLAHSKTARASGGSECLLPRVLAAAACSCRRAQGCGAGFPASRSSASLRLPLATPALLRLPRAARVLRRQPVRGLALGSGAPLSPAWRLSGAPPPRRACQGRPGEGRVCRGPAPLPAAFGMFWGRQST